MVCPEAPEEYEVEGLPSFTSLAWFPRVCGFPIPKDASRQHHGAKSLGRASNIPFLEVLHEYLHFPSPETHGRKEICEPLCNFVPRLTNHRAPSYLCTAPTTVPGNWGPEGHCGLGSTSKAHSLSFDLLVIFPPEATPSKGLRYLRWERIECGLWRTSVSLIPAPGKGSLQYP